MIARRLILTLLAAAALAVVALAATASGASLSNLNSQLSATQSRAQDLSAAAGHTGSLVARLEGQIALLQSRETAVRATLAREQTALAGTRRHLGLQRARLARLRHQLAQAQALLADQLRSGYENDRPDLVTVILNSHGFSDLLEQVDFLHRAQQQQQGLIELIRGAKARAEQAARHLASLADTQRNLADAALVQARALAGMDSLLASRQAALAQLEASQRAALATTRARSRSLQGQISQVQAQQAAAARAAAAAAAAAAPSTSSSSGTSTASSSSSGNGPGVGPALGASGGWAIPYAIVLCESGGQNLPPNSAGASGYYQILPSTWSLYGGSGPAAYLASKSEQDAVASRIWAGGSGASQWVCAGIVGIH